MIKIKLLDKKIIYYLDQNSRMSYSKISRSLNTSPQVIKYRIENLYKNRIIKYCWPMVEYRGLGYFFGLYFIKLQNLNSEREKELFDYIDSHKYIPIVMLGQGYADLIIAIDGKGVHHSNEIMTNLQNKFSDLFADWDTVIPIGFSRFNRNYLLGLDEITPNVAFTGAPTKIDIDKTDEKILSMLNYNARTPTIGVARKIGISYENALKRIKRLEKNGAIQCYTVLLDNVKLGYPIHRILIKFKNLNEKGERKFFTYCNLHPNIIHHLKVLGNWNLVIDVEVESMEKLREIIMDIKFKFSNIIRRVEPTYIYRTNKFRDIPVEYPEFNIDFNSTSNV